MQPGFVETLEVLGRRPAVYYVQRYERNVFTSPARTEPVYTGSPGEVLPRSRVHVSIVAHIAAAHFCEHAPYYRLEKKLAQIGVDLPQVCQVSLMAQLDERMQPLVAAIRAQVWASGYIHLDATPIDLCDPGRPAPPASRRSGPTAQRPHRFGSTSSSTRRPSGLRNSWKTTEGCCRPTVPPPRLPSGGRMAG